MSYSKSNTENLTEQVFSRLHTREFESNLYIYIYLCVCVCVQAIIDSNYNRGRDSDKIG